MDFFKSVLPPLPKLPKLKKIRQWNGGSLLSLNQFPNLPAAFNLGNGSAPPSAHQSTITTSRRTVRQQNDPAPPSHVRHQIQQHMRHSWDISIISAAVSTRTPADYSHRDNLGLYALKCDRSAAKRGILLNLPRKITQAVGGSGGCGAPDIMVQHGAPAMVHEKYSPCKRQPLEEPEMLPEIKPPPRRRKRPPPVVGMRVTTAPRQQPPAAPDVDLSLWQKNSSELFRIVERESASAARARSAGGVGLPRAKKPHRAAVPLKSVFLDAPTSSSDGVVVEVVHKAQSVDNLLAVRYHRRRRGAFAEPERSRDDSDSEASDRQVQSLRLHQPPHHHRRTASAATAAEVSSATTEPSRQQQGTRVPLRHIQPPSSGSTSLPATVKPMAGGERPPPVQLCRASDFSIDNNSDEIEVRFRKGYSTDDSSDATITVPAVIKQDEDATKPANEKPLPPRVVQLRRNDPVFTANRGKTGAASVVLRKPEAETVPAAVAHASPTPSTTVAHPQFMPLAEVLRKSIDSAELKRKWINDFLSQGSESIQESVDPSARRVTAMEIEDAFVPQLDMIQQMDQQLQMLESGDTAESTAGRQPASKSSSVDIFRRTACDFDEFDELFTPAEPQDCRKTVKLSEQITYIERSSTTSNLCFSSSSFSCASLEDGKPSFPPTAPPPPPPPPPTTTSAPLPSVKGRMIGALNGELPVPTTVHSSEPPAGSGCKSTVKIQDYSSKHQHLQRVRYLSSPSPSRSSMVCDTVGNNRGDADSGESVESDHSKTNALLRMRTSDVVFPSYNSGSGYYRTGHHDNTPSSSKTDPLREEMNGLWAVTGRQFDQHTEELNRLSASSLIGINNNIESVLPDYSEYYNEEGVIII